MLIKASNGMTDAGTWMLDRADKLRGEGE